MKKKKNKKGTTIHLNTCQEEEEKKERPREKKQHHVDIYPFAPSSFLYSIPKSTSMHREECCPGARLNIYIDVNIWIGEFTDQNKYPINQKKRKRFSRELFYSSPSTHIH